MLFLVSKTPAPTRPGQAGGAPNPIALAQGLWNTYGSTLIGSLHKSKANPGPPAAPRSTSSSSVDPVQGYDVEQHVPDTPAEED
ncbi:hypothetical protein EWM64_g2169 [Hericium alpestre]|uniref:Uncharacterized protein n=1 Tax=Hericium alpestre TaxID=135208 RepID=A0A4Z0A6F7_9AGAM|nr:hypothetical protein EWM64_g2169 [Hericium alpestre]